MLGEAFDGPARPPTNLPGEFAAAGACQVHAVTVEQGDRVLLAADVGELACGELRPLIHAIVDH